MYIICLTHLKLMMWVLICCLSQTAHFNIQLYLRKIGKCFSFASPTLTHVALFPPWPSPTPSFIHSFILSFIHFDNEFELQTGFEGWGERMKRGEKGGRVLSFLPLSLLSHLATLQRARRPSPFPPVSPTLGILSYTLSICSFWSEYGNVGGETRGTQTQINTPAITCCLICLFSTLHSFTERLSIDFDLSWLSLALCISMCALV